MSLSGTSRHRELYRGAFCIDCIVLFLSLQDGEFEWYKQTQGIILGEFCIDCIVLIL